MAVLLGLAIAAKSGRAATLWNEGVNGDLSNNQAAPSPFALALGANSIIGSVGIGDNRDWVALTAPVGTQLTSLVLVSYSSTDAQGFTGVQAGASFVGNPGQAAPYLGYAHFGTGAVNGNLPPTNLVGVDILPLMGNTTLAAGAQGFTPPLAAGTYTFLIQQTGPAPTSYRFDYTLAAVPEPGAAILMALGLLLLAPMALRRRARAGA